MPAPAAEPSQIAAALRELRQVQRELVERDLRRRADALDEVQEAVERLSEVGSSAGILARSAESLGVSSSFEQVLVSQVDEERLIPRAVWRAGGGARPEPIDRLPELVLRYPLVEAEIAGRGGEALLVTADGPRSPAELRELLGWRSYLVAPIQLRGATIGLLHAEPGSPPEPGRAELDREVVETYAQGLAAAFERAVLRETIQRHREELQAAVGWLGDHLDEERARLGPAGPRGPARPGPETESLTRRETEVMELLGRGKTNAAIASSLLISESTVKFHVKNILLKLGATSRADAVARHLRGGA